MYTLTPSNSPSALCLNEHTADSAKSGAGGADVATSATTGTLVLYVGLSNGVMQRAQVDATGGTLSDTRTRFLGAKAVKLFRLHHAEVSLNDSIAGAGSKGCRLHENR